MAVSSSTLNTLKPTRIGATIFGVMSGSFVDASPTYAEALAVVSGHFQTTPPVSIVYVANATTNGYDFVAVGRM